MWIELGNELAPPGVQVRRLEREDARQDAKSALLSSPRAGQSRSERTKESYVSVPQQVPGKVS
jgi:hypothetical protein